MNYIMDEDGTIRQVEDVLEWPAAERWKHCTTIPRSGGRHRSMRVSTVFLGIDHNFCGSPPILFETMVFGEDVGPWEDYQERYTTKEMALRGHNVIVAAIRQSMGPGDLGPRDFIDPDKVTA